MKNYKIFMFAALLFVGLGASSCFDITEEYHFKKDGSGSAKFTMDMAQMMEMMESFAGAMDSTGEGGMDQLNDLFESDEMAAALSEIPGISNVKSLSSKETKIFGYSYEFENVDALNNAIAATGGDMNLMSSMMMGGEGEGDVESEDENMFVMKGKKLQRLMSIEMPSEEGETDEETEQYKQMA
ncbi:MAG: hypothetical protein AAF570_24410, partial [Bacteroidota bacterium]